MERMPDNDKAGKEPTHSNVASEPKVISIAHDATMRKDYILMPFGYYYNQELQKANIGDILLFSDGKRREIEYISVINLKSGLTDYLCRKTYVANIKTVIRKWEINAEFQGYGQASFHRHKCLLIFLKEG